MKSPERFQKFYAPDVPWLDRIAGNATILVRTTDSYVTLPETRIYFDRSPNEDKVVQFTTIEIAQEPLTSDAISAIGGSGLSGLLYIFIQPCHLVNFDVASGSEQPTPRRKLARISDRLEELKQFITSRWKGERN
jgi:hypothetical protein